MTNDTFLRARGLRKSFGQVEVLHGVDLDLAPGTVTALLGENGAGKSTLVRIIAGDHHCDGGEIAIDGTVVDSYSVAQARRRGIRLISQEISDAPTLSVAENVVLGAWPQRGMRVDRSAMRREASEALQALGTELDLDARQDSLRLGERQIVEVARALRGESRLVIFDEPTASLSDAEAKRLYGVIESLTTRGVAVLYITHRLDEVFAIADRVCVLRDGKVALVTDVARTSAAEVVASMVGHSVERTRGAQRSLADAPVVLELTDASAPGFGGVNLAARRGEILGLYGKVGSGVAEVAEALFAIRHLEAGSLALDGTPARLRDPQDAIGHGIGFLPPDRARQAAFVLRSVAENLAAPSWRRLARWRGWITRAVETNAYRRWHDELHVRSTGDATQLLGTLSGGNQQKVLLGRWLEAGSRILVLSEPTRGVDVGAREEIYAVLRELAAQGTTLVVASSDYEDIVAVADTAIVMVRGRVAATIPHHDITVSALTEAAGGAIHV
ncbi:sugar ABC transporter ATP-binding protein [Actinotalea sp. M2MS4P-6]|uniref:sugar ABC transporter ATP-binding protein n=1 Tax=Actinotalea sp. M2MS4P-6 TaxID=2983762 RepID=UPI0021E4B68F|nr:sugar ABC transporter ATP-binding protein [Actinotalea sp. M2MS4P-6]MCV2394486.1 sugar ABC transporter ATP-binding protein [Actinotalea sp. M2MS4P-6]